MRAIPWALLAALLFASPAGCGDRSPAPSEPPVAQGGCATCHDGPSDGPPGLHGALGCERCHLGDARARTAEVAHLGIEREAGALQTVDRTCGQAGCHAREAERVRGSMMATGRGLVAVDRWAFGELSAPEGEQTIADVLAARQPTPSEDHLRRLCAGCHLGTRRGNRDDAVRGAGSGCSACHSASRAAGAPHPSIDGVVPDARCLGCHSRSGRISLGYQGLAEVHEGSDCAVPERLFDGRPGCRLEADVHHTAGLSCTDCHLHTELMGDGRSHAHQEQALEVSCAACHGPSSAANEATWADVVDPITAVLLARRGQVRPPEEAVRRGTRGTPLWNLRPDGEGGWRLQSKGDGRALAVPQVLPDADHGLAGHERLTCSACHSAWAPLCPECHTSFDPAGEQWDFGAGRITPGRWVEAPAAFGWGLPSLGARADGAIVPVVPGMFGALPAVGGGGDPHSRRTAVPRRFAPTAPHTTSRAGRSCASCHLEVDGPLAWTPEQPGEGTRVGLRALDATEHARLRAVAACLPCHESASDPIYAAWDASRRAPIHRCGRSPSR